MARSQLRKWIIDPPGDGAPLYAGTRRGASAVLECLSYPSRPIRLKRRCPGVYGWTPAADVVTQYAPGTWLIYTRRGLEQLRVVRARELSILPTAPVRRVSDEHHGV